MASNTYVAVGNKEDVSDIITNIAPYETPLYTRLGRVKATETNHEWLEDDLGAADINAQVEGFTYFTTDAKPRVRLGNYTQIMSRGVHVTQTQEAVLHYGLRSEIAYQMTKTLKELAFDCEKALIEQDTKVAGSMSAPRFAVLDYYPRSGQRRLHAAAYVRTREQRAGAGVERRGQAVYPVGEPEK